MKPFNELTEEVQHFLVEACVANKALQKELDATDTSKGYEIQLIVNGVQFPVNSLLADIYALMKNSVSALAKEMANEIIEKKVSNIVDKLMTIEQQTANLIND